MKKDLGSKLFLILIFAMCLVPSAGMLIFGESAAGANERLASRPALICADGSVNTELLPQLSDYAGDRFFLRQELITAWSGINAKLLGSSAADNVILGRNGWLYYGATLPDYCGTAVMTPREIFAAARNLALMQEYCRGLGADFLFTLAPDKNSLYPENMPERALVSETKNRSLFYDELARQGVDFLDLFAVFEAEPETLYFALDSHWNGKGAALAADSILSALGRENGYFAGPFRESRDHRGDLYAMLYPTGRRLDADLVYDGALDYTITGSGAAPDSITLTTLGGGEGTLLMYRDSFGNNLFPYLADAFESAKFSRAADYDLTGAAEAGTNCVVVELVERNLRYLLTHTPVLPSPQREIGDMREIPETVSLTVKDSGVPGCSLVRGELGGGIDDTSPVFVCSGDDAYEAFLDGGGGFAAYIPAPEAGAKLGAACLQNGEYVFFSAEV